MKYTPMSGVNAGKRNFKAIEKFLRKNPKATGADIARGLNLSKATVYRHLKEFQVEPKQVKES